MAAEFVIAEVGDAGVACVNMLRALRARRKFGSFFPDRRYS